MKESPEERRRRFIETAKAAVSNAYASDEHAIIEAINMYLELEKSKNVLHERLEEWYSIYFPELRTSSQELYTKFIINFGANKKEADEQKLHELFGGAAEGILAQIQKSIGKEPSTDEYEVIRKLAEIESSIINSQNDLDAYLKASVEKMMPNIAYLIDYKVAAELLAKAGSLNKLAVMPSGTIQLLGAEKALFKHIKFGSKPPKYGVIFKLPAVSTAGRWKRGKIARLYATKLSIAARADAFSKNFIAKGLKESIDKGIQKINSKNDEDRNRNTNRNAGRAQTYSKNTGNRQEGRNFNKRRYR